MMNVLHDGSERQVREREVREKMRGRGRESREQNKEARNEE